MKLLGLTKAILESLNPSDLAMDLRRDDPPAGMTLNVALATVESYLEEAAVQARRIVREQKAIREYFKQLRHRQTGQNRPARRRRHRRPNSFRAVHFYLTCWRMIGRHLDLVSRTCGLTEVDATLAPHRGTFKEYQDMRDHYEHFDERLPGQRNVHRLAVAGDLGNFVGYTLTFGGKTIDIGPKSLVLLKGIVSEVLTAYRLDIF